MKPKLVIGLGNSLLGDEGVGWHAAARLMDDPRLPADTEVIAGGTDLLAFTAAIEGRGRVVLIDAMRDAAAPPGTVTVFRDDFSALETRQGHAHHLSVVQAMQLLEAPFTLAAVSIASAAPSLDLSPELEAAMPAILARVLAEVAT